MGDDNEPHPWEEFLKVRMKVIKWLKEEEGYNDFDIARVLSMTESQVYLIRIDPLNDIFEDEK